ncbi:uncharacterized protein LOC105212632 [Zeugodacus cucurbitae]|uniref:uncharacterized protein LOC105212632 n=1 Tax=Zeugodacus cucurbitae TaxID=28588 RepID=UPI0023D9652E|nr:uncharacterized protein LOC105212632 [Zeugodacus cucurbitae]
MSAGCNFVKPLKAAMLEIEIFRRNKMEEYKSMNMKVLIDACKLESAKGGNGVINYIISMSMRSLSSVKCPLRGNMTITRMPIMIFIAEGFFAEGEYKVSTKVYSGALTVLNLSLSITSGKN